MKTQLLNAITVDLIDKLDFVPAMDHQDNFLNSDTVRTFEKRELSEYTILELVDLGCLSNDDIKGHLNDKANWLETVDIIDFKDKPSLIEIFIIQNLVPPTVDVIKTLHNSTIDRGLNISFILLDMANKFITVDWGIMDPYPEIEFILEYWLDHDTSAFETLPNLEDIINRQEPEPVLEEVSKTSPATYVLISINIVIWLIGEALLILNGENPLKTWGIKDNSLIISGQYWRLFTSMFLHIDLMHLAANCFSLLIFGSTVERVFGTKKYIFIYLLSGLAGSLTSFTFSKYNSLGASGAIMGIEGALIYLWINNRYFFSLNRKKYLVLVFMVSFSLFYGFLRPDIDNYAHIGGFLCGFLLSYPVNHNKK